MERARSADKAISRGDSWGLLHGLPMTVKDAFEVSGIISTGGAKVWKNHIPETNAEAVQKLIDAGAIIFGKTTNKNLNTTTSGSMLFHFTYLDF